MIIRLGDKIKLGGDSIYQLASPISGLETPAIRVGDGVYAGLDGAYMSSELYGARTIVLNGFFLTNGCEALDSARDGLVKELRIRYLYPIFIQTFGKKNYYTEGYLTNLKAEVTGPKAGQFQITLFCPDPIIYDGGDGETTDSSWVEQTIYKEGHGGFDLEYTTPVQWTAGEQATAIENLGNVAYSPIITLKGTFTNPTITNVTTGKLISLQTTTTASDTIIIDLKNRVITKNGGSIASYRTTTSTWWTLQPGLNKIVLSTTSNSDTDFGTIKFRNGYAGV